MLAFLVAASLIAGYMFGQYKRLNQGSFEGVLTGKAADWGGSYVRPEATGWGLVFFAQEALKDLKSAKLSGKRCAISGAGNVAQFAAQQLLKLGAVPVTFSDSGGTIYEPDGFTSEVSAERVRHALRNVKLI